MGHTLRTIDLGVGIGPLPGDWDCVCMWELGLHKCLVAGVVYYAFGLILCVCLNPGCLSVRGLVSCLMFVYNYVLIGERYFMYYISPST